MTNYEVIKEMSIEEFVSFILSVRIGKLDEDYHWDTRPYSEGGADNEEMGRIRRWIEQQTDESFFQIHKTCSKLIPPARCKGIKKGEYIRTMTDEELAEFLKSKNWCRGCMHYNPISHDCFADRVDRVCSSQISKYLSEKVE